ncbi:hypothetical protein Llab_0383 [Lactococcus lactis]|nr:hypothetical protein Llab_0383 [Lactococcus lactis]
MYKITSGGFLFKKIFVYEKNYHFLQGSSYKYNKIESFI